jgi:hypothetical protein
MTDLRGGTEVERGVAGDVVVLLEVLDHLLVGVLPVEHVEATARLDQLLRPRSQRLDRLESWVLGLEGCHRVLGLEGRHRDGPRA